MRKFLVISAILVTASMSSAAYAGGNTIGAPIITVGSPTVTVGTRVNSVVATQPVVSTQTATPVTTQVDANVAVAVMRSTATATSNTTATTTASNKAIQNAAINFGRNPVPTGGP